MHSRLTQFALILPMIVAMLASSVSACTCGHHEAKAEEPVMSSCHGSHAAKPAEIAVGVETVDGPCVCYVSLPTPFIIGDNGQHSSKHEKQTPSLLPGAVFAAVEQSIIIAVPDTLHSDTPIYLSRELTFTPSRAPPRL